MLSFFPRDVLDGILDLTGSVSEGFPTYFSILIIIHLRTNALHGRILRIQINQSYLPKVLAMIYPGT